MTTAPVLVEVRALAGPPSGVGRYVAGLLGGLRKVAPRLPLLLVGDTEQCFPAFPDLARVTVPPRHQVLRLYRDAWSLPRALRRLPARLVHLTKPSGLLWGRHLPPVVMTIYDVIPLTHPRTQALAPRIYWRTQLPLAARRAAHILTLSETSKRAIVERLRVPPERVTVTYPGLDARFAPVSDEAVATLRARLALSGPYLLSVGTIEPRKGLARLLEVFARIARDVPHHLVIAGRWGWKTSALRAAAADPRLTGRVRFLGSVPDPDLPALYRGAEVFICLSDAEGFCFPPLEALACGTPVVASGVSCLPEVVGPAARLVDPQRVEEVATTLTELLSSAEERGALRRRGIEWVKRYSWEETARRTVDVYNRVTP